MNDLKLSFIILYLSLKGGILRMRKELKKLYHCMCQRICTYTQCNSKRSVSFSF